jgi:hypothetical protein
VRGVPAHQFVDLSARQAIQRQAGLVRDRGPGCLELGSARQDRQDSIVKSRAYLFRPQTTYRVRWNTNSDTPLPVDVPAGENPPDGAMIDFYLGSATSGVVTLEIKDAMGQTVRRYSSDDPVPPDDPMLSIPPYWVRPPQKLSNQVGLHRFLWDLHLDPVPGVAPQYPIAAVYKNTAPDPTSPWAMPGKYTVVLTAGGKKYEQPLALVMDPRVKTSTADLAEQFKLSKQLYDEWLALNSISDQVRRIRGQITELRPRVTDAGLKTKVDAFAEKLAKAVSALKVGGKLVPLDVKKGDEVLFSKYGGTEVKVSGEEYLILRESDILAKVVSTKVKAKA